LKRAVWIKIFHRKKNSTERGLGGI
jgi:hypothetical protein